MDKKIEAMRQEIIKLRRELANCLTASECKVLLGMKDEQIAKLQAIIDKQLY